MRTRIVELSSKHEEVLQFILDCQKQDEEYFDLSFDFCYRDDVDDFEDYYDLEENVRTKYWSGIYVRGNCYFFAKLLKAAFPEGEIVFATNFSHAAVTIDGLTFDAMGIVFSDSPFVLGTKLMHMYAEAWSHDYEADRACGWLYPQALENIIQYSTQDLLSLEGWDEEGYYPEENLLWEIEEDLYRYFDDESKVLKVAVENGWSRG